MTPPDLDADVVHAKLRTMRALLDDLKSAGTVTAGRLDDDRMLRHALERIMTQLVELAVSINGHAAAALLGEGPPDYHQSFGLAAKAGIITEELAARLAPSAGLRNVLVHEYATVDLARVAAAIPDAIDDYGRYVAAVASALREREGQQ